MFSLLVWYNYSNKINIGPSLLMSWNKQYEWVPSVSLFEIMKEFSFSRFSSLDEKKVDSDGLC